MLLQNGSHEQHLSSQCTADLPAFYRIPLLKRCCFTRRLVGGCVISGALCSATCLYESCLARVVSYLLTKQFFPFGYSKSNRDLVALKPFHSDLRVFYDLKGSILFSSHGRTTITIIRCETEPHRLFAAKLVRGRCKILSQSLEKSKAKELSLKLIRNKWG